MNKKFWLLILSLCVASQSFGYTVILKNGKKIEGTLVSENSDVYIIKGADGIQMNTKKSLVDADKTVSANQPSPAVVAKAPSNAPPKTETKQDHPAEPRKAGRTITQEDLEKLRQKYDLGQGTFSEGSAGGEEAKDSDEESGSSDLRSEASDLRDRIKQAEESYADLQKGCDFASSMTTQGGTATKNGERVSISDSKEEVCGAADDAKKAVEDAKSDYDTFVKSAKSQGVTQDWLESGE